MIYFIALVIFSLLNFGALFFILSAKIKKGFSDDAAYRRNRERTDELLTVLNETVDSHITLIETKIKELKTAIDAANRKIALLERETDRFQQGKKTYSELAKKKPLVTSVVKISKEEEAKAEAETKPKENPAFEVKALYREGKEPHEIAGHLNLSLSQVELILSMVQAQTKSSKR